MLAEKLKMSQAKVCFRASTTSSRVKDSTPGRSGLTLQEALWRLYQASGRRVDTSNFALAVYDARSDTLDFPLFFQRGKRTELAPVKLSDKQGLVGRVLTTRLPLLIRDLPEAGVTVETDPIAPEQPIRSWLSVPIHNPAQNNGTARGVLAIWSDQPGAFTERQLGFLCALGAQAATVIENARLYERTQMEREQLILAEEQARKALARDLHDGPIQLVGGISMCLDFCRQALEKEPALLPEQISYMQELVARALRQMRTMLFELRPLVLETEGLEPAVRLFLERRRQESHATTLTLDVQTCQADGELSRQEAGVEAAIFAIVREAVNNALKHAQANVIQVCLKETPIAICAAITDDGAGFAADQVLHQYEQRGSLGLVNIRERAEALGGTLTIRSAPGQGTCVSVCIPTSCSEVHPWAENRAGMRTSHGLCR